MDTLRKRIRAGDQAAFAELFDTCARSVYNHAYRLTGDWSTAEDVVSLTFLEAWRLRARVDAEGETLRPWLLGIATNTVRNTRRAARRHAAALSRVPPPAAERDFADDVAGRIDDAELLEAVQVALRALRRPEREVLALCGWSGLDYAAAARALGVPVGTVRSRLSRARKKLAAAVEARRTDDAPGRAARGSARPVVGPGAPHAGREPAAPAAPRGAAAGAATRGSAPYAGSRPGCATHPTHLRSHQARPIQEGNR
ncbi:RNA polymerase sigma factor [Streptomyces sp. 796.1]|uniref:RNA polymerase sigma factor n=1 Tax=Streptomyces sp. 796.1 TaxID=3163029 RepID=UPI0039C93B36